MGFNKFVLDKDALTFNVSKIKSMIGKDVKLCGVVKAEAYGHGGVIVANEIKDKCDFFAVACLKEAMELRDRGIDNNIIILGIIPISDVKYCIFNNISITLSSLTQLYGIINKLKELNLNEQDYLKIHIKINTGLNRIGFNKISDFLKAIDLIDENKNIKIEGMFTHFATKSNDVDFIKTQYDEFQKYINLVKGRCIIIHNNNSYATLNLPQYYNSMVRCGYLLYGWQEGFKPVLSIHSEIVNITKVDNGTVGYDRTFIANGRKIAVVPIGYADGLDRRLSNNFKLLVDGQFANVVGNICMDVCMLDVTDIKDVKVGSKVTILGRDGKNEITVFDYANALGTSPYEILLKFRSARMDLCVR